MDQRGFKNTNAQYRVISTPRIVSLSWLEGRSGQLDINDFLQEARFQFEATHHALATPRRYMIEVGID